MLFFSVFGIIISSKCIGMLFLGLSYIHRRIMHGSCVCVCVCLSSPLGPSVLHGRGPRLPWRDSTGLRHVIPLSLTSIMVQPARGGAAGLRGGEQRASEGWSSGACEGWSSGPARGGAAGLRGGEQRACEGWSSGACEGWSSGACEEGAAGQWSTLLVLFNVVIFVSFFTVSLIFLICCQTPWENGLFWLTLRFTEDYPSAPPSCELCLHPAGCLVSIEVYLWLLR